MKRTFVVGMLVVCGALPVAAQFPEDALRLAQPSLGIGGRALGMGSAFMPIADDYSATFWNPAGLAQIKSSELTIGLSNGGYTSDATFLSSTMNSSTTNWRFDDFGAVIPIRHSAGMVVSIGYNRVNAYDGIWSFNGLNAASSRIGYEIANYSGDATQSLQYLTGVAGIINGQLKSPVNGGLLQTGTSQEGGGLHAWSFGAAATITDGLFIGGALHVYSGSYTFQRHYTETDVNDLYTARDTLNWTNVDLKQYTQYDDLSSNISGLGGNIGVLYALDNIASFALDFAVPSSFHVREDFSSTARGFFDDGSASNTVSQSGYDEYDVTTPLVFSAGAAAHPIPLLTVSGVVDVVDYTALRFSNADQSVLSYNFDMNTLFRTALNYRFGAEYKIAPLGVGVRAGYQFFESAYAADPSSDGQKTLSFGASVVIAKKAMLDVAYSHGTMNAMHTNYDASSATTEKVSLNNASLTFSVRF